MTTVNKLENMVIQVTNDLTKEKQTLLNSQIEAVDGEVAAWNSGYDVIKTISGLTGIKGEVGTKFLDEKIQSLKGVKKAMQKELEFLKSQAKSIDDTFKRLIS
ncbi:hypothetical protein HELRODRAFT_180806 [Helobdella robusta]|uniref:Uncharacterized protein n=1 Tax=Helobdella robusta TaxID=6412 RepID=T1FGB0_HELRO|nr:hypothetical protein HELRODRAFT_180806 [Helobdella robusta]ESN93490.1 hypothetical protein HELRODRAFT_180806 [Helobdella robusta]